MKNMKGLKWMMMKADLYSTLCRMIFVTFKLFDIRYYQPHKFNTIANENVKKYVAILSTPIPDQTKNQPHHLQPRMGSLKLCVPLA